MQFNTLEHITIDRRSTLDFSIQIKENIKALILDRTFYYQTALPHPNDLARYLNVPIKTIDEAYESLMTERYINYKKEAYYVSYIELTNYFFDRNTAIYDAIIALGLSPSIECLEKKVIKLPQETIQKMGFDNDSGTEFFYINRLYYGNQQPIILLENYLPLTIFPGIDKAFKGDEPLNDYIGEHYGFKASLSKRFIKAVNLPKDMATVLNERPNAASIQSTNQVYDKEGRMIDYGRSHSISSYYFQALIEKAEMTTYFPNLYGKEQPI